VPLQVRVKAQLVKAQPAKAQLLVMAQPAMAQLLVMVRRGRGAPPAPALHRKDVADQRAAKTAPSQKERSLRPRSRLRHPRHPREVPRGRQLQQLPRTSMPRFGQPC